MQNCINDRLKSLDHYTSMVFSLASMELCFCQNKKGRDMNHFASQEKIIYDSRLGRSFPSSQDHVKAFLRISWIIQKKKLYELAVSKYRILK